jgi:putative membrane protein
MMGWNDEMGWGWGGWLLSGILMILFWGLVIWGIVAVIRYVTAPGQQAFAQSPGHEAPISPEQILAERFARGEIGEEEYGRRLAVLRSPPHASGLAGSPDTTRGKRTVE